MSLEGVAIMAEHVVSDTGDVVDEVHGTEGAVVLLPGEGVGAVVGRLEEHGDSLGAFRSEEQTIVLALHAGIELEVGVAQVVNLLHAIHLRTVELHDGQVGVAHGVGDIEVHQRISRLLAVV